MILSVYAIAFAIADFYYQFPGVAALLLCFVFLGVFLRNMQERVL